ncbi:MerC domain-containing protein [Pseudozobellia thermophila]|uniref:MerC mercury resistance protein n=1 Tax=Pseudozobellia thermophila TaxID=192903 RepID=A0A1M6MN75_9FLAO|nr:MerC domain-containing protein [Pseudozobellia thermophila]SHJ84889.1 MerC mercury resistance protein [Pseudozobellia thermophila]
MNALLKKPDTLGAWAGSLCLVHCVATPFLFLAQACSGCDHAAPDWWKQIDSFFLVLSFWAVYRSTKTTRLNFIKPAMWAGWATLTLLLVNEKLEAFPLPEAMTYLSAFVLVGLHLYNKKYCTCKTDSCCAKNR